MTRALLNAFPTWLLGIVIVGAAVAVSVGGLVLVRRRFPELERHGLNDVIGVAIGVLAAVFGLLLGFVTVSLYDNFTDAQATVQREATEVIQLYNDSRAFAPPADAAVLRELKSYVAAVRFVEWDRMREGDSDMRVGSEHITDLYRVLQDYEPKSNTQNAFYGDAVGRLNDIVDARRSRLTQAEEELPGAFSIMLLLGTALLIASMYLLATTNRRLHTILLVGVAVLTSFNLLIVAALDHPFSGDISVSNEAFNQGRLKALGITPADIDNP